MTAANPSADELLGAVARFIETQCAPALKDRDAFLARVAVNALETVRRELALAPEADAAAHQRLQALLGHNGDLATLNKTLCEDLRSGVLSDDDPAVVAHLTASAIAQARIDQPNYSGLKAITADT